MNKTARNRDSSFKSGRSGVTNVKSFKHGDKSFLNKDAKPFSIKTGKNHSNKSKPGKAKDFSSWKNSVDTDDKGKTNWNQLKTQMKSLREQRKKNKKQTFYDSYKEVKLLWEKLRLHSCKPEDKGKLCAQIMTLIKGNIKTIVKSHDMARIVQWLVKLGSDNIREQIFSEISEDLIDMSKNKYSKHTIKSLLQHCSPSIKKKLIGKCCRNIYGLTCNKVSAPLVQEMFRLAGPSERQSMVNEFYGGIASDINLETAPVDDEVTKALLNKSCKFLTTLVDKGHNLHLDLVHSVLYDYLLKCNESNKKEMINNLKSHFRSFMSSKDGIKIFSMILFEMSAKEKKGVVKEFKTDIKDIALGEHSSMALLLLIDSVDDTVLIKKAVVPGIIEHLESIASDEHGRKILIYLMVHRDSKYFHPKDIEWLSQFDSSPNVKKDSEQKIHEIQEALIVPLSEKIKENPKFWFNSSSIAMVTLSIIKVLKGEHRASVLSSVTDFITDKESFIAENDNKFLVVEHSGTHMVLKKIIANDQTIENETETFSSILVEKLNNLIIETWIGTNRGCFILVALLETKIPAVIEKLKKKVNKVSERLNSQSSKGSQVLKKVLIG